MKLVVRHWDPFDTFGQEMNRLLDTELESHQTRARRADLRPSLNLYESDDAYTVTVELPGERPEQLRLDVTDERLKLAGEREPFEGIGDQAYRRQERWFGKWDRELVFPKRVVADQIVARMAHGLLTITVPKSAASKPRRIEVLSTGE